MAIKAKITSTNSAGPQKVSVTVPAGGGAVTSVTAIGDLTNVTASSLPDGAILQYATASGQFVSGAPIDDDTFPAVTATAKSIHSGESIRNFILDGTATLTNKTIDLDANSLTGTITEFNSALQSADFATLANTETFTNKTITQPKIAEIDSLSSGGIVLDADADITLDADGADIILKDGGTEFGRFTNSSGELVIKSSSSSTTALTFSGSSATLAGNLTVTGTSTFNGGTINLGDAATDTIAFNGTITGSLVFEGSTSDSFETTLTPGNPTADITLTLPSSASDTLVGKATTDTLTNKSIDLANNTITGSVAEFNSALQSDSFVTLTGSETLSNKQFTNPVIAHIDGTGGIELDAVQDITLDAGGGDIFLKDDTAAFGALTNSSGNLIIKSGTTTAMTFSGANVTMAGNATVAGNLTVQGTTTTVDSSSINVQNALVFEGATADSFETTLTTVDPTADRTVSLPNATDTLIGKATTDTLTNKTLTTPVIAEIDSNASITLDAATDIILDAGEQDIILKDDGTEFGRFTNSSGELVIKSGSSSTTAISMSGANVTIAGNLVVTGATENDGNITIGDAATDTITFGGTIQGSLVFEGSTADSFETTLTPGNPSGDITLTLPSSATDTIVARNTTDTLTNKTLTSPTINAGTLSGAFTGTADLTGLVLSGASPLVFEGSTNNSFETTLAVTDPTADRTISLPNSTGTLVVTADVSGDATMATSGALTLTTVNSNVGQFGSTTSIPVVTVNAKGLVTALSTATIVTTLTVGADSGSNDAVSLATDTLNYEGGANITTTVSNNNIAIALDASPSVTALTTSANVNVGGSIVFEGSTADSFETTLAVTDPTADRTITFPNSTGTVALTSDITGGGQAGSFTNLTSSGNTVVGNATGDTVTFNARVASDFVPSANDTHSLGSASLKWAALHVSGSTIFLGNAQLSSTGTTVVLPANSKVGDRAIPDADPITGIVTRGVPLFTKTGGLASAAATLNFKASGRSDFVFEGFTKADGSSITTQERALFSF